MERRQQREFQSCGCVDSCHHRREEDCSSIVTPPAATILILGEANAAWSPAQLSCLPDQDFLDSLSSLATVTSFSLEQLSALKDKALQVYGSPVTNEQIASLKRISLGFTDSEVTAFFSSLTTDTLSEISSYSEWASPEFRSRSSFILSSYLGLTPPTNLTAAELVALGYFLCVMPPNQITQIRDSAYRMAAWSLGHVLCPDLGVLAALKNKALEEFGSPESWGPDVCQEVGAAVAGLSSPELSQLPPAVMPFLEPQSIALIPPAIFAAFSIPQLSSLGPENSLAVSEQQRSALTPLQRDAIAGAPLIPTSASGPLRLSRITAMAVALLMISAV